jgi:hypothetical protein
MDVLIYEELLNRLGSRFFRPAGGARQSVAIAS